MIVAVEKRQVQSDSQELYLMLIQRNPIGTDNDCHENMVDKHKMMFVDMSDDLVNNEHHFHNYFDQNNHKPTKYWVEHNSPLVFYLDPYNNKSKLHRRNNELEHLEDEVDMLDDKVSFDEEDDVD